MTTIKKESTVSRILQQQIPTADLDGTFKTHDHITQFDTDDKSIADDLNKEYIVVNEVIYKNNVITSIPKMFEHIEIVPTSNLTEYNKVNVLIDRSDHLFYFDYTENNKRVHLKHSSGTFFTIDDDGNYNLKVQKDNNQIIKGAESRIINFGQNILVNKDRKLSVKGNDYVSVGSRSNRTVGMDDGLIVGGSQFIDVGLDKVVNISGFNKVTVNRYKEQNIGGSYSVISRDFISFRAPTVIIDAGQLILRSKSSISEQTAGKREIMSEKLVLSGIDGVSITSMGNYSTVVKGISEEVVSGIPALPSGTDMKIITVNLGGFKVETKVGPITLNSVLPMLISLSNPLGSIGIGLTGKIDLASPTADISITESGVIEINGLMGSINVGMSNLELDHSVMIKLGSGASSEFAVLGNKLMTWLNNHVHPSGCGPTSAPSKPATPTDFGSTKVFIE